MKIQKMLLTPNPYSRPQMVIDKVTKIVIHWVGNANSTALNNRNYFENLKNGTNKVYASSHYIVGLEGEIIQCVPENEVAYHASSVNSYSIGIENCHPDWSGKFNDKTYQSLIKLCADICYRYKLDPQTALIRHYDVTGKNCPLYYVKNVSIWKQLKSDVTVALQKLQNPDQLVTTTMIELNGTVKEVERILYNGTNYIKLRDLADARIQVDYDATAKRPIVKVVD